MNEEIQQSKNSISSSTSQSNAKQIDALKKQTHFTRQEVEELCRIFKKLTSMNPAAITAPIGSTSPTTVTEAMGRTLFREILHNAFDIVTEEALMERIFCAFDKGNDAIISLEEWVCGLSVFLKGTIEERTAFSFYVYDLNSDGYISKEEMFHLLRDSLVKQPQDEDPDEGVKDLLELALRKMDLDKDGKISFMDFSQAVTNEPLLLEAFGQCLPTEGACQTFLATLEP